jgi:peptidyl-prolyl cis-trans isomerase C
MEPGEVAGPVKTDFGWHVIRLNEVRQSQPPSFEEIRPDLESQLRQEQVQAAIEALRADAEIDRPETGIPADAIRANGLLTQ